jgi:hypothetical protein
VHPDSKRSICFTSGYSIYCEGTGSVLQMADKVRFFYEDEFVEDCAERERNRKGS